MHIYNSKATEQTSKGLPFNDWPPAAFIRLKGPKERPDNAGQVCSFLSSASQSLLSVCKKRKEIDQQLSFKSISHKKVFMYLL